MTTFLPVPQMMAGFSFGTSGNPPMENPSAWQTIHQPFIVSCLTLWSPGCWPQPIQRKEWDSGTFENLRVLSCAMVETCPSKVP
ncbi:DCAF5 isoform 6 [Pan troglodytes]|uniref:DCAF5 isoform 6 n=1 Tax=Pan troglodytes TaxID=9598 RepID=A0A2J8PIZ4_PANTR|nr:DCAF5 isoform 6 [Pan troglodytes]